jgi:hypothetical protein
MPRSTRRDFLTIPAFAALDPAVLPCQTRPPRPNLLFLASDQHSSDMPQEVLMQRENAWLAGRPIDLLAGR